MPAHNVPPELGEALSWRELRRSRGFALLELAPDSEVSSLAADRGLRPGIGQASLEELDVQGVLQPVAFAAGGNPHEFTDVTPFEPRITFREEEPAKEWQAYAWDNHGRPHTSALYSPWQLLYLDNVTDPPAARVGLDVLRAPTERRDKVLGTWRDLLEAKEARWHALDSAWRPLMKVLVRLQNRYLPEVTGQSRMLYDTAQKTLVDPWPAVLSGGAQLRTPLGSAANLTAHPAAGNPAIWQYPPAICRCGDHCALGLLELRNTAHRRPRLSSCHVPRVYFSSTFGVLQLGVWVCCIDGWIRVAHEESLQIRLEAVLPSEGGRVGAECGADDSHPLGPRSDPRRLASAVRGMHHRSAMHVKPEHAVGAARPWLSVESRRCTPTVK